MLFNNRCLAGRMAMHACQIGPTDTAPPCSGPPQRACVVTKGERFGADNLTQVCGQCDYTLPSFCDQSESQA